MTRVDEIRGALASVRGRIASACVRCGRRPDDMTLVVISKFHPASDIRELAGLGVVEIGENRVQEALAKQDELRDQRIRWHLVGSIQTNKVKHVAGRFQLIQSLDRAPLADALQAQAEKLGASQDVLIQVDLTGEATKHGVDASELADLIGFVQARAPRLNLRGLMTIGPNVQDERVIRDCFRRVHDLYQQWRDRVGGGFDTLSMGMTGDFEIAIEEGSTMVRLGTAILGQRTEDKG